MSSLSSLLMFRKFKYLSIMFLVISLASFSIIYHYSRRSGLRSYALFRGYINANNNNENRSSNVREYTMSITNSKHINTFNVDTERDGSTGINKNDGVDHNNNYTNSNRGSNSNNSNKANTKNKESNYGDNNNNDDVTTTNNNNENSNNISNDDVTNNNNENNNKISGSKFIVYSSINNRNIQGSKYNFTNSRVSIMSRKIRNGQIFGNPTKNSDNIGDNFDHLTSNNLIKQNDHENLHLHEYTTSIAPASAMIKTRATTITTSTSTAYTTNDPDSDKLITFVWNHISSRLQNKDVAYNPETNQSAQELLKSQLPTRQLPSMSQLPIRDLPTTRPLPKLSDLTGVVWPKPGSVNSDRILSQIKFMRDYSEQIVTNAIKMIFLVHKTRFEPFDVGRHYNVFSTCPVNRCVISTRSPDGKVADALLIKDFRGNHRRRFVPKPANQIWITYSLESPRAIHHRRPLLRGLVNWTSSYRSDSTIVLKNSYIQKVTPSPSLAPLLQSNSSEDGTSTKATEMNYAAGKTKLVSWLVSNCASVTSNRQGYVDELSRYINIDVYGKEAPCSQYRCPQNSPQKTCYAWLGKRYKFYLAFENSNCKEYITEKFYRNALGNNMLPIVLGASREDYAAVAPPHSYIHVDDFRSPQHLAVYLHKLNNNDTLYNSYFKWKGTVKILDQKYWCRLCMMLHLRDKVNYVSVIEDFHQWWESACVKPYRTGKTTW